MKYTVIGLTMAGVATAGAFALAPIAANAQAAMHQAGMGTSSSIAAHDGSGAQNRAGNGYQASLENRAKALNMTSAQLTIALQTRTMDQIMADQGLSLSEFQAKMNDAAKVRWESQGLSASEVQARVEWQQSRHATATHDGMNHNQGGYGRQENE